jgi:hypothetical protein
LLQVDLIQENWMAIETLPDWRQSELRGNSEAGTIAVAVAVAVAVTVPAAVIDSSKVDVNSLLDFFSVIGCLRFLRCHILVDLTGKE